MNQQLTIGRIVHVYVDPRSNNGADTCPAILTRVWGTGSLVDDNGLVAVASVNMRLLLDHPSNDLATQEWRTSAQVFASRGHADAFLEATAAQNAPPSPADDGAEDTSAPLRHEYIRARKASGMVAFMPARV